ncbi:hypothetical protein MAR_007957 [Mya arenaria]|uniref:Uncharacterized protein n=1 Tax=Mya arenaria TaxID=6604 RepID=A0ABY7DZ19_MYAAR|nr:hypothetical protein MAR_007957 [Mya arenaria]
MIIAYDDGDICSDNNALNNNNNNKNDVEYNSDVSNVINYRRHNTKQQCDSAGGRYCRGRGLGGAFRRERSGRLRHLPEEEAGTSPLRYRDVLLPTGERDEDEAISRPVAMTPFALRKLYIETFPYSKWKRGFDGSLRPHMSLRFVDPRMYAKSRGNERQFRAKINNYENSDRLTLRSSALSRMMQDVIMPTMSEVGDMEAMYEAGYGHEMDVNEAADGGGVGMETGETPRSPLPQLTERDGSERDTEELTQNNVSVGCDVELM